MAWQPDYLVDDEYSNYEQIADDVDDVYLGWAVTAASRAVDDGTNRQFGLVDAPEQRFYTPRWSRRRCRWIVTVDDFQTVTGLAVALDTAGNGSYSEAVTDPIVKLPLNAAQKGLPWTMVVLPRSATPLLCGAEGEVGMTARWGWTTIPIPIKQATALQASRFLARRSSPYGIAGSPETGSEMRLLAKLDPDVMLTLKGDNFWRPRVTAK